MAYVDVQDDRLNVRLSFFEKLAALRRSDVSVDLRAVTEVEAVAEPFRLVRGLRMRGLLIPRRTRIGTWWRRGDKVFAAAHRHREGIRIRLRRASSDTQAGNVRNRGGHPARSEGFDGLLVSIPDPERVADRISSAAPAPAPNRRLVRFRPDVGGIAGVITVPDVPVRAAAVIITGSGELNRDGSAPRTPLDVSRQLAESLRSTGVASIRYDKRGVGASGGEFLRTGVRDNVDDAEGALDTLAEQPECSGVPIVVIGHSEGAMLAMALAARRQQSGVAGQVLLAAPATVGRDMLEWQARQIAPTLPRPIRAIMRLVRTDLEQMQRKNIAKLQASSADVIRVRGTKMNAKWMRELIDFDPAEHLSRIEVPTLAITGAKDLQVDPDDLDIIARTVRGPVVTRRIPDLSHILRRDPGRPSLSAYRRQWKQPVDVEVLRIIEEWIGELADRRAEQAD